MLEQVASVRKGVVRLTTKELQMAITEAGFRHINGLRGCEQGSGYKWDMSAMGMDVNGVAGEIAFCKMVNLYWSPGEGPQPYADVGAFQIKTTHHENGKLIIVPHCHNDLCVLMVGHDRDFRCAGWIKAQDGRQEQWRYSLTGTRPATYNVPQAFLYPLSEL
jgi:hypothetical protein